MASAYKLKLLSGILDGVEYTLLPGDTVFAIGRTRELHDATLGHLLAQADNVFYLPEPNHEGALLLRCGGDVTAPQLLERQGDQWVPHALVLNAVLKVAGLSMAVRNEDQPWSSEVLQHRLALPLVAQVGGKGPVRARRRPRVLRHLARAAVGLAVVSGAGWWAYSQHRPDAQVRTVEAALARSPYRYQVVHDGEGNIHAFTDGAAAVAWGQRAGLRAGRLHDQFVDRAQEAARLGALLDSAGIEYAVIRLRDPAHPEVIITATGNHDAERRKRTAALLGPHMPYAVAPSVRSVGDAQLMAIAQGELRARGITTRIDPRAGRASVVNDVFLDDAALNAMVRYRDDFSRQWGARRVRIRIRLWDDLLKGRSYQYSHDQLLSVGDGRWEYSSAGRH